LDWLHLVQELLLKICYWRKDRRKDRSVGKTKKKTYS